MALMVLAFVYAFAEGAHEQSVVRLASVESFLR